MGLLKTLVFLENSLHSILTKLMKKYVYIQLRSSIACFLLQLKRTFAARKDSKPVENFFIRINGSWSWPLCQTELSSGLQ
jgi:hypothetical protein